MISPSRLENEQFKGSCVERLDDNSTVDADGNFDAKVALLGVLGLK